jgi:hypothetical protein
MSLKTILLLITSNTRSHKYSFGYYLLLLYNTQFQNNSHPMTSTLTNTFDFKPICDAVQMTLSHTYSHAFHEVANAFLLKYNFENRFCFTTIASSKQLDDDRFEIVRRMENTMSSTPVYERIIFNRRDQEVNGFTFETDETKSYIEHYVYKQQIENHGNEATERTLYEMYLHKNPGLKKILRYKLHSWGVQTTEGIIKSQVEFSDKFRETLRSFKEAREKLVLEAKEKSG